MSKFYLELLSSIKNDLGYFAMFLWPFLECINRTKQQALACNRWDSNPLRKDTFSQRVLNIPLNIMRFIVKNPINPRITYIAVPQRFQIPRLELLRSRSSPNCCNFDPYFFCLAIATSLILCAKAKFHQRDLTIFSIDFEIQTNPESEALLRG